MNKILALLSLFVWTNYLFCQEVHFDRCGLQNYLQQLEKSYPNCKNEIQLKYNSVVQNIGKNIKPKTTIILPIVVHVLHEGGNENISDLQIYNMISVLNQNFRKQNEDTVDIISEFEGIATDANIEFRLAKIDPEGNYTNGIDRIYSHLTNNADLNSRINAWDTEKYINIWTSKSLAFNGVAAFTTLPYDFQTPKCQIGISILHSYVGEIGTGNPAVARIIVHEMGHFLGLLHPNHDQLEMDQCGDDGLSDTPETKGFSSCPTIPAIAAICNTGIIENYQNFMEFSYCQRMFTLDQVNLIHSVLLDPNLGRNQLSSTANLSETGVFFDPPPIGNPKAAFVTSNRFVCEGDNVQFFDQSFNAVVNNRTWYFTDGTPAISTDQNPTVTFSGLGWKKVKLVVANSSGIDSIIQWKSVHISQNWADQTGPFDSNFDTPTISWLIENPGENESSWSQNNIQGYSNSGCMKLNNFKDTIGTPFCTNNHFYNFQLGGNKDALISPSIDLSTSTNLNLSFNYAYASNTDNPDELVEALKIYTSRNCGKTWVLKSSISGLDLLSATSIANSPFIPSNNQEWKNFSLPYVSNALDTKTRFKFEFNSSDYSNNFYFDNFSLTGTLNTTLNQISKMNVKVFPNPSTNGNVIAISYEANESSLSFILLDPRGKRISEEINYSTNQDVLHYLKLPESLASGIYYLNISQNEHQMVEKVVIQ